MRNRTLVVYLTNQNPEGWDLLWAPGLWDYETAKWAHSTHPTLLEILRAPKENSFFLAPTPTWLHKVSSSSPNAFIRGLETLRRPQWDSGTPDTILGFLRASGVQIKLDREKGRYRRPLCGWRGHQNTPKTETVITRREKHDGSTTLLYGPPVAQDGLSRSDPTAKWLLAHGYDVLGNPAK
jgi:hypothetical protein